VRRTRVPGESLDWRLENGSSWHATTLPSEQAERCAALVHRLGLRYGAIDLVRDAEGALWFLEINPNGEWGWLHGGGCRSCQSAVRCPRGLKR
jgi:glutathione synthase/RimK-type ligase-like ATP-grasp enzyme